jgi:hypothetical protein
MSRARTGVRTVPVVRLRQQGPDGPVPKETRDGRRDLYLRDDQDDRRRGEPVLLRHHVRMRRLRVPAVRVCRALQLRQLSMRRLA